MADRGRDQPPPAAGLSPDLQRTLATYLERQLRALELEDERSVAAERREALRGEVWRMITRVVFLLGYAVVLGVLSSVTLVEALLNPHELARNLDAAGTGVATVTRDIPEGLRGVIIPALGTLVLLILGSVSLNARFEVGGALFAGVVALSVVGLSAAASSGTIAALAALPGLVASIVILHEFLDLLETVPEPGDEVRRRWPGPAVMACLRHAIDPLRSRPLRSVYIALPVLSLLAVSAALAADARSLFWLGRSGLIGFAIWCVWACAVTPARARIPLWSLVGWGYLYLSLLAFGSVSVVFAFATVAALIVNVGLLTLRSRVPRPDPRAAPPTPRAAAARRPGAAPPGG